MSYNFKDFDEQFPDDAACLEFIFKARFANHVCECEMFSRTGATGDLTPATAAGETSI